MKKIVYIMNVEWNWIKQRPQFIAEKLSARFDTRILYRYWYRRSMLQNRLDDDLRLVPIYVLPKVSNIPSLSWINEFLMRVYIKSYIQIMKPDVVYVTYPLQIAMLPRPFSARVIYDCMDNHSAFQSDPVKKMQLEKCEEKLMDMSYRTIVSSEYLKQIAIERYHLAEEKITLVRNAYNGEILKNIQSKKHAAPFKMAYVGTISTWLDWGTVVHVIQNCPEVELYLYGPVDSTEIPKHERIIYNGIVEHQNLETAVKDMDCLIMPFKINEIIRAVDPVKIYEYINFNKDIIMCRYPEVARFSDYVYFYENTEEFENAIDCIRNAESVKYTPEQRESFLKDNSWDSRIKQIIDIIEQ